MSKPAKQPWIPTVAIGSLLVIAVAVTGASQLGWLQNDGASVRIRPEALSQKLLAFKDLNSGAVEIIDATQQKTVAVVPAGDGAFMRTVLRGLTKERQTKGLGAEQPFELRLEKENRLLLIDQATGSTLLLNVYGRKNAQYFQQFLEPVDTTDT